MNKRAARSWRRWSWRRR